MKSVSSSTIILLVDGSTPNPSAVLGAVEDAYHVEVATSAAQVLRTCQAGPLPDLILLDVTQPEENGSGLCASLTADPSTRDIPVILVTATSDDQDPTAGLQLGGADCISKPIRPLELLQHIRLRLALRHAQQTAARLERECAALVVVRDAAEAANAAKTQFLEVISHEIRSPITAILAGGELLGASELSRDQQELLSIVHKSSAALLVLINDFLDVSKIESGKMELDAVAFDLAALLENVLDVARVRLPGRGVTLHCDIDGSLPTRVIGDANRLRQIASNLVDNAIKFTEAGSVSLALHVRALSAASVDVVLVVADTGIGIEPHKAESAFDRFSQADGGIARRFGGSGLGLSIVRSLARMMGGDVEMVSVPKQGTTLTVRLTLGTLPNVGTVGAWQNDKPPSGKVLLIMSQGTMRSTIAQTLAHWGLVVTEAGDAAETHARLAWLDRSYCCIVADDELSDMEGDEIVKAVRANQASARLPVIQATTLYSRERERQGVIPLTKPLHRGRLRLGFALAMGVRISGTLEAPPVVVPGRSGRHSDRILVAQDDREIAVLLRHILADAGYLVDEAVDGEAAVAAVVSNQYGLVLMDLDLPLLDGIGATQGIRDWEMRSGRFPTPIIAVTEYASSETRGRCMASGMNGYLSRPLRAKTVLDVASKWLDPRPLVLVADDDANFLLSLNGWFKGDDTWRVLAVGDGRDVLDAYVRNPVAIVLLDMEMEGLDVHKMVDQLRRLVGGQKLPIIAVTQHIGHDDVKRCRIAGCTGYIAKPCTRDDVMQALSKYLEDRFLRPRLSNPAIRACTGQVADSLRPTPQAAADIAPRLHLVVPAEVVDPMSEFLRAHS